MKFHDELNPKLWENDELKDEVADKLNEIADAFIEYLEVPEEAINDIIITGSSANYNYTPQSDLDLHLKVDYTKVHEDCPIVEGYLWSMKAAFNKEHDISIYGVPVEVYAENVNENAVSNGVYSLRNRQWIKFPEKIEPTTNDSAVLAKYNELKEACERIDDSEVAQELLDKIYTMRKAGLSENGEFSTENLAFKMLRNDGIIENLKALKKEKIDKNLSLESFRDVLKYNSLIESKEDLKMERELLEFVDIFQYDDEIATIENKIMKINNKINNGATDSDLFSERDELEKKLKPLKQKRDKLQNNESYEITHECEWCGEEYAEEDMRKVVNLGWVCDNCIRAIESRGEELDFDESLNEGIEADNVADVTIYSGISSDGYEYNDESYGTYVDRYYHHGITDLAKLLKGKNIKYIKGMNVFKNEQIDDEFFNRLKTKLDNAVSELDNPITEGASVSKNKELVRKVMDRQTDNNEHTKSIRTLARYYGDDEAVAELDDIDREHDKKGYLTPELGARRNKVWDKFSDRYYKDFEGLDENPEAFLKDESLTPAGKLLKAFHEDYEELYTGGAKPEILDNVWVINYYANDPNTEDGYTDMKITKIGLIGELNNMDDYEDRPPISENISDAELIDLINYDIYVIGDKQEVVEIKPFEDINECEDIKSQKNFEFNAKRLRDRNVMGKTNSYQKDLNHLLKFYGKSEDDYINATKNKNVDTEIDTPNEKF